MLYCPAMVEPMAVPFVILFDGRTGSTYLVDLLDSHPAISCVGERVGWIGQRGGSSPEQLDVAGALLGLGETRPPGSAPRAVGFKVKLRDVIDHDAFRGMLEDHGVRIIRMVRHNQVKAAISTILAGDLRRRTGAWNVRDEADRVPRCVVDPAELDRILAKRQEREEDLSRFVRSVSVPTLDIAYEDLLLDAGGTLARVQHFLGVEPEPLRSAVKKATSDDLEDVVLNLDDLRERYRDTVYGPMFDEVIGPRFAHEDRNAIGPRLRSARARLATTSRAMTGRMRRMAALAARRTGLR